MSLEKNNGNGDFEDDYLELLNRAASFDDGDNADSDNSSVERTFEDVSSGDIPVSKVSARGEFEDIYSSSGEDNGYDDIIITRNTPPNTYQPTYTAAPAGQYANMQYRPVAAPVQYSAPVGDPDETSDFQNRRAKRRKKKKSIFSKLKWVVLLLVVVVVAAGGILLRDVSAVLHGFNNADKVKSVVPSSALESDESVKNILFIGLDDANGETSRSDSMMLVSVNEETGKIVITSILRDVHVDIPDYGEAKINAAFSWGGAELLVQTIEKNFGIKIDGYASVDFDMFISVVDALGGVEITMSEAETEYMNERIDHMYPEDNANFKAGRSTLLNGRQALEYARIREIDDDFERTGRQRIIIQTIAEKVKDNLTLTGIFKLLKMGKEVAPFVTTTFSSDELAKLAVSVVKCVIAADFDMDSLIVSQRIPFDDGDWWYFDAWDGSAIGIDFEDNCEILYDAVFDGKFPDSSQSDE